MQNFTLSAILLHFRDKVHTMINKNVTDLSNFEWRKDIKYYRTEAGGVEMRTLHLPLPFHSEYTGNQMRPMVLLSDRVAVQTIVAAWHMNSGLVIHGKKL